MAIEAVKKKISNYQLTNVETLLAKDIAAIPSNISDVIIAIDMFHMVQETDTFLKELHRLLKKNGFLFITMHHMTPEEAKGKILASKLWKIHREVEDCLTCTPIL